MNTLKRIDVYYLDLGVPIVIPPSRAIHSLHFIYSVCSSGQIIGYVTSGSHPSKRDMLALHYNMHMNARAKSIIRNEVFGTRVQYSVKCSPCRDVRRGDYQTFLFFLNIPPVHLGIIMSIGYLPVRILEDYLSKKVSEYNYCFNLPTRI